MDFSNIPPSIKDKLSDELQVDLKLLLQIKDQVIESKDQVIESKDQVIESKDQVIKTRDQVIKTRDQVIKTRDQKLEIQELKFKSEIKKLEERLCAANYKVLLSQKLLTIRSFMRFIWDEFHFEVEETYEEKFEVLANENLELLKKWKIDKDEYYNIYKNLMKKLNQHAHPFFDTKEAFILNEDDLKKEELQFIGFLWSVVPLHEKNLFIRKSDKEVTL